MQAPSSEAQQALSPVACWDDETVRSLHRHMRIQFRYLSPAVRQMTLQQCMEEIPPSLGVDALVEQVNRKLSL